MVNVTVQGKKLTCAPGDNLYHLLRSGGININAPCGGTGRCGKCTVNIPGVGKVKACQYSVREDIEVILPKAEAKIAVEGMRRPVTADHTEPCIAVDIGTTTVVAYLLQNGAITAAKSALNVQKPFGDDVLSRINYVNETPDGLTRLSQGIRRQVHDMAKELCAIGNTHTETMAIAGNTVMLHLFAGISPASIGVAPFAPVFTEQKNIGKTVLLPSIAGYVGADIVTAILASGMHLSDDLCLLVDIGTNGEIALGNKEGITVCAAAAGPAFEGAQITCGVGGIAGAINHMQIENGKVSYTTIDHAPPVGICGSGILDAVAEMLRTGLVDESGYFEEERLAVADGISVTAADIRQVQLAKAAIAAGIHTLLNTRKVPLSAVKNCYLAGGFGSYLNKHSACAIGLLPPELKDRITSIGNAAGIGAGLWLVSSNCRTETEKITRMTKYLELSSNPTFNTLFMSCMDFA